MNSQGQINSLPTPEQKRSILTGGTFEKQDPGDKVVTATGVTAFRASPCVGHPLPNPISKTFSSFKRTPEFFVGDD